MQPSNVVRSLNVRPGEFATGDAKRLLQQYRPKRTSSKQESRELQEPAPRGHEQIVLVGYFCSRCHEPSQLSPGGAAVKLSRRLINVIDGPSSGTATSAASNARRASSQCRAR